MRLCNFKRCKSQCMIKANTIALRQFEKLKIKIKKLVRKIIHTGKMYYQNVYIFQKSRQHICSNREVRPKFGHPVKTSNFYLSS